MFDHLLKENSIFFFKCSEEQKKKRELERERELAEKHHAIITLPVAELAQYIEDRRVPQEDYYLTSFWDFKINELQEQVQEETKAQHDFLKSNFTIFVVLGSVFHF